MNTSTKIRKESYLTSLGRGLAFDRKETLPFHFTDAEKECQDFLHRIGFKITLNESAGFWSAHRGDFVISVNIIQLTIQEQSPPELFQDDLGRDCWSAWSLKPLLIDGNIPITLGDFKAVLKCCGCIQEFERGK